LHLINAEVIFMEKVLDRLLALKRYDVGTADEGDGYLYNYSDEDKEGRWVKWDDVEEIVNELTPEAQKLEMGDTP
jgi:hypothetical protein